MSIREKRTFWALLPLLMALSASAPRLCRGQEAEKDAQTPAPAAAEKAQDDKAGADEALPGPPPVTEVELVPTLNTVAARRDRRNFNVEMVSAALLPRDKEGIWVLDFGYKPVRIRTIDLPGKGRRPIHYLYYKVVNRTGKPRMFVPQFIMVNEAGQKIEDQVIPQVIPVIQAREDPTIPILGAVRVMGMVPASTKEGIDDAVYGAAVWEKWDTKADRFSIYVRGLSDGYKEVPNPNGGKPIVQYKTLRLDFIRRGDEHNISEKEIELGDPPYVWVYW